MDFKRRKPREVNLWVGTRKGAFLFRSDLHRKKWEMEGPYFPGREINHIIPDPRTGLVWATVNSVWWGSELQFSSNNGKTWKKAGSLRFESNRKLKLNRIWSVTPDRDSRPNVLWCGVDPGALFRSDNNGKSWREITSLTRHPTRKQWNPGAGGLCAHTIIPDPNRINRIYVAISAAGCFRSDDDGKSWAPKNQNVRADFNPNKFPEVGQCVHRLTMSPEVPDKLFQQNHCGLYRSDDAGDHWIDISKGSPSRFGFPIVAHPHKPETIYVVPQTSTESRFLPNNALSVFRSTNGGRSWQKLTSGLPQKNVFSGVLRHSFCADTCDEAGLYLATTGGEIFYSRNNGDSWQPLHSRLPTIYSLESIVF